MTDVHAYTSDEAASRLSRKLDTARLEFWLNEVDSMRGVLETIFDCASRGGEVRLQMRGRTVVLQAKAGEAK